MSAYAFPEIPGCTNWIGARVRVEVGGLPEDFKVCEIHVSGKSACVSNISTSISEHAPPRAPATLTFGVLEKRDISTLDAVRALANRLNVPRSSIGVGGLKDRRAVTYQFITAPGHVQALTVGSVRFTPLGYRSTPYSPKEVWGNGFQVNLTHTLTPVEARSLESKAPHLKVPSFYGHQRFGAADSDTHLVGLEIVRGNYGRAIQFILGGTYGWYERKLEAMLGETRDEEQALRTLDPVVLRLFVNAYQSYVFNKTLSTLLGEYGSVENIPCHVYGVADRYGIVTALKTSKPASGSGRSGAQPPTQSGRGVYPMLEIPGYSTPGGSVQATIMAQDGVEPLDFRNTVAGGFRGGYRPVYFEIRGFSVRTQPLFAATAFSLRRGMYATVALRALLAED
ncbi:MAG: tRNA pseudouridine(13) synthase TruD [Candidatus Marsarchaeota archaeon]|nr:tRNA pseudouridine(13) synthase TruD [Candidatus Marsarchaeota archaeon]